MPQNSYVGRHRPRALPSRGRRHVIPVALVTATVAGGFVVREAGASELSPAAAAKTNRTEAVARVGQTPDPEAVAAATAGRVGNGASRSDSRRAVAPAIAVVAAPSAAAQAHARAVAAQAAQVAKNARAARARIIAADKAKVVAANRAKIVQALAKKRANSIAAAHRWVAPVSGYSLTSGFGYRWGKMHAAQDLARPVGGSVRALSSGTVVSAGWDSTGYGNLVRIQYWDGTLSWMAHNSQVLVTVGERVTPGQVIARSGDTGQSTGPHVHLEIHPGRSAPVPPLPWLAQRGVRL